MGRKRVNCVYEYFHYDEIANTSKCLYKECGTIIKGKHGANLLRHFHYKHKAEYQKILENRELRSQNAQSRETKKNIINIMSIRGRPYSLIEDEALKNIISLIPSVTADSPRIQELVERKTYEVQLKGPQDPQPKLKQLQRQELVVKYDQPGPSTATSQVRVRDDLAAGDVNSDPNVPVTQVTLNKEEACRICGELYKDLILAVNKPYLSRNKATLTLNDMCVEIDLNDDELPAVCVDCDGRLLDLFNFMNHVRAAQESLSVISGDVTDAVECLVVKVETPSPTPDDDEAEAIDSGTHSEAFVKENNAATKRKSDILDARTAKVRTEFEGSDTTTKMRRGNMQKKVAEDSSDTIDSKKGNKWQTSVLVSEELIIDIKKEIDEDERVYDNSEFSDTVADVKPSLEQLETVFGSEMSSGNLDSGCEHREMKQIIKKTKFHEFFI